MKTDEELAPSFLEILTQNGINATLGQATQVIGMMKQKVVEYTDGQSGQTRKRGVSFVRDLWPLCDFFFVAPTSFDRNDKFVRKNWKETTPSEMQQLADKLRRLDDFSAESQKNAIDTWAEETGIKPWNAWRICLVGKGQGPDMYELAAFLGKEETLGRMEFAIQTLA